MVPHHLYQTGTVGHFLNPFFSDARNDIRNENIRSAICIQMQQIYDSEVCKRVTLLACLFTLLKQQIAHLYVDKLVPKPSGQAFTPPPPLPKWESPFELTTSQKWASLTCSWKFICKKGSLFVINHYTLSQLLLCHSGGRGVQNIPLEILRRFVQKLP